MCQFRFHKTILLRFQTRCFLRTQLKHGQAGLLLPPSSYRVLSSVNGAQRVLTVIAWRFIALKKRYKVLLMLSTVFFHLRKLISAFLGNTGREECLLDWGSGSGKEVAPCLSWKGSIFSKESCLGLLSQMNYRNMWLISPPWSKAPSLENHAVPSGKVLLPPLIRWCPPDHLKKLDEVDLIPDFRVFEVDLWRNSSWKTLVWPTLLVLSVSAVWSLTGVDGATVPQGFWPSFGIYSWPSSWCHFLVALGPLSE